MSHTLDGITPSNVESPRSLEDLSRALKSATDSGNAVVPWGGGTRMGAGNTPARYDTAIDLTGYTSQLEHVAGDMTVVVDAGVRVADLSAVLAKEGQRLPFEVRNASEATVGGSVASNAPGRRQSSTGGIRDWVIGMQIVLADGTVTKTGGRVVKNVQGYDLHRLHTGAFGTLGIISQTAFKLVPIPPEKQTVVAWFDDTETAIDVGLALVNGLFAPEVISLVSGPLTDDLLDAVGEVASDRNTASTTLLIRLGGGVRSIERQVNEVTGAAGAGGAAGYAVLDGATAEGVWDSLDGAESTAEMVIRVSARAVESLKISEDVQPLSPGSSTICDLGFGALTVLSSGLSDDEALSFSTSVGIRAAASHGSHMIEKCPLALKRQIDVFSDVGDSIEVMRRIKNQYDPQNTLNPGRFVGRI